MSFGVVVAIILAINLVCAVIAALMAVRTGRDPFGWVLVCAVLGPFGLGALLISRPDTERTRGLTVGDLGEEGDGIRVLLPVDGSDASLTAVRFVIEELRSSLGSVVLLAVLPVERAEGSASEQGSPRQRAFEEARDSHLAGAEASLRKAGIPYTAEVRFGEPGNEILALVAEQPFDQIVMGRRGRGGVAKMLLGSVSDNVTKNAETPVTVVG